MKTYLVTYAVAVLVAAALSPVLMWLGKTFGLLDQPNPRKVHATPTPRLGGVAILIATLLAVLPAPWLNNLVGESFRESGHKVITIAIAGVLIFLVGLADDVRGVPSRLKLLALLLGASAVCVSGTLISSISLGSRFSMETGWFAVPLTIGWIICVTVGINFIDGLDGLAAGIAAITCGVVASVAATHGQMVTAVLAFALLGSLSGFLIHNTHPARIFMGDCGSMFVGFILACSSILSASKTQSFLGLVVPAVALGVPILDAFVTVLRRGILHRSPVFLAERGHIHHRLLDMGFEQRQAVLVIYVVTIVSSGIALVLFMTGSLSLMLIGLIALLPVALFRVTDSLRLRKTLSAFRRNYGIARHTSRYRGEYANYRIRLSNARSFVQWWQYISEAADALDLSRITLKVDSRDGTPRMMTWFRPGVELGPADVVSATIPVRQRRAGSILQCELEVPINDSVEIATQRMALFSRLITEGSLAELPLPLRSAGRGELVEAVPSIANRELGRGRNGDADGANSPKSNSLPLVTVDRPVRRIAVVHDFLYTYAGAERVLEQILQVYPEAEVYSLFDFLPAGGRGFIGDRDVQTTFLQRMPFARKNHRIYLPLMPLAIEQLDVSSYALVISSSYLAAKGVMTRSDQLHICYCHTPVRFAWDLQQQYLSESGLFKPGITSRMKSFGARLILHYIRNWDIHSSSNVDVFLTNSDYIGRRIRKLYRRDAVTMYPPVDVEGYTIEPQKEDFYLTMSRLVPYKRIDLIVEAFNKLSSRRLIVIGEGPDLARLRGKASANVTLLGYQPHDQVRNYMQRARAFVFAAEEDFGIVPVEAQACGTPIIAYARGGVMETVIDGVTGVLFHQQTVDALVQAISDFESSDMGWDPEAIRANAERFSAPRFRNEFRSFVETEWHAFKTFDAGSDEPSLTGRIGQSATVDQNKRRRVQVSPQADD